MSYTYTIFPGMEQDGSIPEPWRSETVFTSLEDVENKLERDHSGAGYGWEIAAKHRSDDHAGWLVWYALYLIPEICAGPEASRIIITHPPGASLEAIRHTLSRASWKRY